MAAPRSFNVIFLVACGLLVNRWFNTLHDGSSIRRESPLQIGRTFLYHPPQPQAGPVLYVHIMPAYSSERLYDSLRIIYSRLSDAKLIVLAADQDGASEALRERGVTVDLVAKLVSSQAGITSAPMFVAVDSRREVKGVWRGVPDSVTISRILASMTTSMN